MRPGLRTPTQVYSWGAADGAEVVEAGEGKCGFMLGTVGNGGSCSRSCGCSTMTPPEAPAYWQQM